MVPIPFPNWESNAFFFLKDHRLFPFKNTFLPVILVQTNMETNQLNVYHVTLKLRSISVIFRLSPSHFGSHCSQVLMWRHLKLKDHHFGPTRTI